MKQIMIIVVSVIFLCLVSGAGAEEITYTKHIKPVFNAKCIGCHGPQSPELPDFDKDREKYKEMMKGPRMDNYIALIQFIVWPDTGAIMRRLDDGKNTKDGKPGNMYQYLSSKEEERQQNLKLFKEWVGNWTLKRWKEISKEELDSIKVKY